MKKFAFCLFIILSVTANAQMGYYRPQQPEQTNTSLPDNRWFIGSGLGLGIGFSANSLAIGANPEVGYTVSQLIDVGMSFNINYYKYGNIDGYNTQQKSFNYGVGAFARIYPFDGFFLQALPEYNWINTKLDYTSGSSVKYHQGAASLLVGVGFGRRIIGQSSFYTAIMVDVGSEIQSPYKNYDGSIIPVLRTGFNFYLGSRKK
ncbi:MAG: hypothetical protein J0I09_13935 [Sphingobacteriia bacterium]|nr:hypothetical protein [Sphingobacteriia bacterium]